MNPVSPLPALIALLLALAVTAVLTKRFGAPAQAGRFASIDGVRGYLAFFVFMHHASVWYFYLHGSPWEYPPSRLYIHFGHSSVAMFFMITGFLFFTKLLHATERPIDWLKLAVSRVLRLAPLYALAMLCLFTIVAIVSNGKLNDPVPTFLVDILQWLSFTIGGAPDINGVVNTRYILAGVTWSLPYEWFFYLSLPLLALAVGAGVPRRYLVIGTLMLVVVLVIWHPQLHHLLAFVGGIVAAFIAKSNRLASVAQTKLASVVVIGCLAVAIWGFPRDAKIGPVPLVSVAFVLIACGNSLFGLLTHRVSRTLGEMAYSIYMLHGLVLFICFRWLATPGSLLPDSPWGHWAIVLGATPVLIVLSFITFNLIEQPAMQSTGRATAWLRARWARPMHVASD